jgi:2-polyprenyl-6-methoxyphenol hydroxylase-like FAD-dependent oxidoreductase
VERDTTDVLVVGAGPGGLMAGICLARLGVGVIVVDGKDGPTRESRALALQARTMEIYDQLGLVDRVLARATAAPRIVPGHRSHTFGSVSFTGMGRTLTPYPGIYILEQSATEAFLGEAYVGLGGDLRWRNRLTSLTVADDVEATLSTPAGDRVVRARWCIGADGSSSTVRQLRGIAFGGTTSPLRFYVADALDATGLVEDAVNMRVSADDFLLTFPMGGAGHHRLLGVADEEPEGLEGRVRERLRSEFRVRYDQSAWFASYHVHHRVAERFRDGPVFLVGDAAHVHSPVGAQGMNTGLQDAHNLACALADVAHGRAEARTLDRYQAERRPVAVGLVRFTDGVFSRITSGSRTARLTRDEVIPLVGPLAVRVVPRLVGTKRLFGYVSQTRIHYKTLGADGRDRVVGRRLPWTGPNHKALRSLDWQVHHYGPGAATSVLGLPLHRFPADPSRRLDPGLLYLVRPDGFVAAAAPPERAAIAFARAGAPH